MSLRPKSRNQNARDNRLPRGSGHRRNKAGIEPSYGNRDDTRVFAIIQPVANRHTK